MVEKLPYKCLRQTMCSLLLLFISFYFAHLFNISMSKYYFKVISKRSVYVLCKPVFIVYFIHQIAVQYSQAQYRLSQHRRSFQVPLDQTWMQCSSLFTLSGSAPGYQLVQCSNGVSGDVHQAHSPPRLWRSVPLSQNERSSWPWGAV